MGHLSPGAQNQSGQHRKTLISKHRSVVKRLPSTEFNPQHSKNKQLKRQISSVELRALPAKPEGPT